jgi:hypothetical protein
MKKETLWLLAGAGVVAYLMFQQQSSPTTVSRVRFRPYSPPHAALNGIPGGTGGYAEQGQGFGMEHRSRHAYDG